MKKNIKVKKHELKKGGNPSNQFFGEGAGLL